MHGPIVANGSFVASALTPFRSREKKLFNCFPPPLPQASSWLVARANISWTAREVINFVIAIFRNEARAGQSDFHHAEWS